MRTEKCHDVRIKPNSTQMETYCDAWEASRLWTGSLYIAHAVLTTVHVQRSWTAGRREATAIGR